jgi:hypothetical protein
MGNPPTKIWLKVTGDIVKDGQIEINHYAIFLQNLQKAINCLREVKYPDVNESFFKLYSGRVYKSSHLSTIGTIHQSNLNDDPVFNEMNQDIERLVESLIQGDTQFIAALSESITDPGEKLKFLKSIKKLLSKRDYKLSVGFAPERPKKFVRLPSDREGFIDDLIKEYTSQASFETYGVIIRHKGDEPRNFVIKTGNGEIIVCHYPEEMESYVHDHWKDPLYIKGIVSKSIRKNEMDEIIDIKPFKIIPMQQIGGFKLLTPIYLEITYDKSKNLWKLFNKEISVYGSGITVDQAKESFVDAFERLIVGILAFNEEKLSDKSKEIKHLLEKYLNFNDYLSIMDSISSEE